MRTVAVLQHTEAEYLGLIEDHLEGRNIRFTYFRPFTHGGTLPLGPEGFDGLWLLGGGPYGLVSGHLLPSAAPEFRLTRLFLDAGKPVVGIGLGALILCVAAGGGVEEAPLRFAVDRATAVEPGLLGGHLPDSLPISHYLRDRPVLPPGARVLAEGPDGGPQIFTVGNNSLGFLGHPGFKHGMVEDLVMEFSDTPDDPAQGLAALAAAQAEIAEGLTPLMVGIVAHTGLM
jgi:GMP synthase-like glutamine amidotransferase